MGCPQVWRCLPGRCQALQDLWRLAALRVQEPRDSWSHASNRSDRKAGRHRNHKTYTIAFAQEGATGARGIHIPQQGAEELQGVPQPLTSTTPNNP